MNASAIIAYYLDHADDEDVEQQTCKLFNINEAYLIYLLEVDAYEQFGSVTSNTQPDMTQQSANTNDD